MLQNVSALAKLHEEIDRCLVCREQSGCEIEKPVAIERGCEDASVMAIGVAPGRAAQDAQKAFAGNSFSRMSKWFAVAGFPSDENQLRRSLYLTSLNKCAAVPDTYIARRRLWTRCQDFLWRQIETVRPRLILLLGLEPAAIVLDRRDLRLEDIVGQSWTTEQLFGLVLFPRTQVAATWLSLPHPSGLSRTMNDPALADRVIMQLRRHLEAISFRLSTRESS
jgi:uracil-DNA glycosylase family 4